MNKNNVAFLFPGQGAQYPGMALDFLSSGAAQTLFQTASDIFGKNATELLQSSAAVLKRTDVSQPAITLANLVAAAFLGEQGYSPAACAGFSLGEYAALVSSGVLDAAGCLRLVKARGEAMQIASDRLRAQSGDDAAPGMAAVIGLAPGQVEELVTKWNVENLYVANINSPKQTAVSGTAAALAEAETRFKEAGARRVIRLQVAGPFHCPLMADSAEAFRQALDTVTFHDPSVPLYSNVSGKRVTTGKDAKKLALLQITHPVRWVDEEAAIAAAGVDACLEVGPGKVLQGLWRDSGSVIPFFAAGTVDDIKNIS
ncbi:MAG: ACP S-malonyltransferase [Treponema sp.]|jgi:[acyl-carrier-protein] S-malonyltransferase|nr:ACP S-malonyltransferase [Treponema sp.]